MTFLQTIAVMCLLVTTCRTALKDCKDTWSDYCWTEIDKNISKCDEDLFRRNCKRICGLCGVCTDIFLTQCASLIHRCHENGVRVRCRKTCSLCPGHNERRGRGRFAASTTPTTSANVQLGTPMLTVNSHLIAIHNVSLNTKVNFKCSINRPSSSSTLHLYKVAGRETKDLRSTTGSSNLHYAFTARKCQDAGFFYCLAESHIGRTNSTTVQLNIFCRPRLVSNALKTVEIVQGSGGQFAFEVVAYPSPSVEHFNYHKEETMSPSRQEPVRSGLLSGICETNAVFPHLAACKTDIKGATLNDGGLYSFTVRNNQGPVSVNFRLTVTEERNFATKSQLVWIGILTGLVFFAFVAGLSLIIVIRRKRPTHNNATRGAGTLPSATHMTSGVRTSGESLYANTTGKRASIATTEKASMNPATEQNPERDLYSTVDKSRKQCSLKNTRRMFQPDLRSKPENMAPATQETGDYGGTGWSENAAAAQSSERENIYRNNANAGGSMPKPCRKQEDLVYTDLDFSQYQPDRQRPLPEKQEENYAAIDFSKAAGL